MRLARFLQGRGASWGIIRGKRAHTIKGPPYGKREETGEQFSLKEVKLLAPTAPSKIVCVGLNYADHAAETGKALPEAPQETSPPSAGPITSSATPTLTMSRRGTSRPKTANGPERKASTPSRR